MATVSFCSKPSENPATDGDLVSGSRIVDPLGLRCLDRRENFHLPSIHHGIILVKFAKEVRGEPPFKIYGDVDSGREEMIF